MSSLFALAVQHQREGRLEAAISAYRGALEEQPDHPNALNNLGVALKAVGRLDEAVDAFRRCLTLKGPSAPVYNNLANALVLLRQFAPAEEAFGSAIALSPDYVQAHSSLAWMLYSIGRTAEAISVYRRVTEIDPGNSEAHYQVGMLLHEMGDLREVKHRFRLAIDTGPPPLGLFSRLLFLAQTLPDYTQEERLADARKFGAAARGRAAAPYDHWLCEPAPRRLRVGIVSGDLRQHVAAYYLESVVQALDPARIELIAYSNHAVGGALTDRLQPYFSSWRPIHDLKDEAAARRIHDDAVHVLIDLSGHTAHNRLGLFAWRPAPVQATWIGYFATTGMEEIDYFLCDPYVLPVEDEPHFVEKPWRLPGAGCLTAPDAPVHPNALPALTEGVFTFGCLNTLTKMTDEVVALWSRILHRAPNSRLFLKAGQLSGTVMQDAVRHRFAAHAIGPERLLLEGWSPRAAYFEAYHRVDVALDPFPFPGATTSIEGLWMGVPVITRRGDRFLSRVGESIAHRAGLSDWIAADDEAYVEMAVALAADPTPLIDLRRRLRPQVLASSLFDAASSARDLQDALIGMWRASPAGRPS